MTDFASHHVGAPANPAARVFNWIRNGLIHLAESGSQAQALKRLSEMSDADFAARGTTRAEAVRRFFAGRFYM